VFAEIASAVPNGVQVPAGGLTNLLTAFTNSIRKELGYPEFVARPLKLEDIPQALKELSDETGVDLT
jgi:hypothetical protein